MKEGDFTGFSLVLESRSLQVRIDITDCLKGLSKIEDDSIDVSFADPPFNLSKSYSNYNDNKEEKEYIRWCEDWISELVRVTKPSGSIFIHNIPKWLIFFASYLNECYPFKFKHWITWDAPSGSASKKNCLQPSHYGILYYCKNIEQNKFYKIRHPHKRCRTCDYLLKDYGGKKDTIHWFGPLVSDNWTDIHRVKHGIYKCQHPCTLPVHLLERILLMSTDVDDIVLDPFMGSGTTAVAAKRLGRKFVGFDISEEYVNQANKRVENTVESKVGEIWVSKFPKENIVTARDVDLEKLKEYYVVPEKVAELNQKRIFLNEEKVKD